MVRPSSALDPCRLLPPCPHCARRPADGFLPVQPKAPPVAGRKARIQLLCGNGYVWDADGALGMGFCMQDCRCVLSATRPAGHEDFCLSTLPAPWCCLTGLSPSRSVVAVAHWLRLECGLIGASVGGVAGVADCIPPCCRVSPGSVVSRLLLLPRQYVPLVAATAHTPRPALHAVRPCCCSLQAAECCARPASGAQPRGGDACSGARVGRAGAGAGHGCGGSVRGGGCQPQARSGGDSLAVL